MARGRTEGGAETGAAGATTRVRKPAAAKVVAAARAKAKAAGRTEAGAEPAQRTPRRAAAKAAVAAVVAAPAAGATLRKKDLIERVARVAGARKKDARGIVEATLTVLGEALAAGEVLALPPFGKARVNRQKDMDGGGAMLTVKLRRPAAAQGTPKVAEPAAAADA
jgi:DNA-binding protein HU-alpha